MRPLTIKHTCGHTTLLYRNDDAALAWAKEAQQRTCGCVSCRPLGIENPYKSEQLICHTIPDGVEVGDIVELLHQGVIKQFEVTSKDTALYGLLTSQRNHTEPFQVEYLVV